MLKLSLTVDVSNTTTDEYKIIEHNTLFPDSMLIGTTSYMVALKEGYLNCTTTKGKINMEQFYTQDAYAFVIQNQGLNAVTVTFRDGAASARSTLIAPGSITIEPMRGISVDEAVTCFTSSGESIIRFACAGLSATA